MKRFAQIILTLVALVSTGVAAELKSSVVSDFFEAKPGDQPVGACHGGLVIDKTGNIYVTTDTPRGILVFSSAGKFQRAVGPSHIHALEIREENGVEYIYAARPTQHEVVKLRLDGERTHFAPPTRRAAMKASQASISYLHARPIRIQSGPGVPRWIRAARRNERLMAM